MNDGNVLKFGEFYFFMLDMWGGGCGCGVVMENKWDVLLVSYFSLLFGSGGFFVLKEIF